MQLVGDKFADARVLQAARAYEAVQPFVMPKPDPVALPRTTDIAQRGGRKGRGGKARERTAWS
jgi:hypothetical protein